MGSELFKLSGSVEIMLGKAERDLKRLDAEARQSQAGLDRLDKSGRGAGAGIAGGLDRATGAAGRLGAALSSLSGKMGGLRGAGGGGGIGIGSLIGGNLASSAIEGRLSAITGALKGGISAGIQYNKMLENAGISFRTLLGSTEKATAHLKELQAFGESTPFEFPDLIKASQRMQAMGFTAEQVIPSLRSIGDAVSAVGGSREELDGVVLALGQMQTKGKVSAEEMNQLAERGIPAWDLLARAIGRTKEETIALSEQGRLSGGRAVEGLVAMMGNRFGGQMDEMSKTLTGRESNFNDIVQRRLGEATKTNTDQLKAAYEKATIGLATAGAQAFVSELNKMTGEIGKLIDPALQGIASGAYFTTGASVISSGMAAAQATVNNPKKISEDLKKGNYVDALIGRPGERGPRMDPEGPAARGLNWLGQKFGILGSGAAESFNKGVTDGADGAKAAGAAIGGAAEAGVRDSLQQRSPSRVMLALGHEAAASFIDAFGLVLEGGKGKISKSPVDVDKMRAKLLEDLRQLRRDPNVQAMLDTIASAEGADYSTLFGGGTFGDFSAHPNQRITRKLGGKNLTSTAAGRYQFLSKTWQGIAAQTGLTDFSPESQDLGAIFLMKQRGMLGPLGRGDLSGALTAGNREWASLPGSPYGQPTKRADTLIEVFETSLSRLTQATVQLTTAFTQSLPVVQQFAATPISAQIGQGGSLGGMTVTAARDPVATLADLPPELSKLSMETSLAKAALMPVPPILAKAESQAGMFADAIMETGKAAKEAIDHFAGFRDSFASGFDGLFDSLLEGGKGAFDAIKRILKDATTSILGGSISSMTGGRAGSPGQLLSGLLFGGLGGQAAPAGIGAGIGAGAGGGGFLTGGFAGGNPAQAILGGGGAGGGSGSSGGFSLGGVSGLLRRIPGLGKLFGGGAKAIGGLPTITRPDVFNPALGGGGSASGASGAAGGLGGFASLASGGLLMGGGLLGGALGKGPIGKLMGSLGGTLAAGAAGAAGLFGGGVAAALPALFSNPFTAIIGGALIGGALLSRLLGDKTLKSLRGLIRGEYGIEVKANQVLENVKALGESKFGKDFKKKQIETVRLPETKDLLTEYAARSGQKGNSKLVSSSALQDEFSSTNQFQIPRREMGGPVSAGRAYLVGERRPEVFVPSTSGQILPSVQQFTGRGGASEMAKMLEDLREAVGLLAASSEAMSEGVTHLRGIRPDDVITKASPGVITEQVAKSFSRRDQATISIREMIEKR